MEHGPTADVEVVLAGYLLRLSHSSSMAGLFRLAGELRLQVSSSHLVYDTARRSGRVYRSCALVGRATGIKASLYSLPGPVPVQSTTFVGRRSRVDFTSLGKGGVSGMITVASDSHLGA